MSETQPNPTTPSWNGGRSNFPTIGEAGRDRNPSCSTNHRWNLTLPSLYNPSIVFPLPSIKLTRAYHHSLQTYSPFCIPQTQKKRNLYCGGEYKPHISATP